MAKLKDQAWLLLEIKLKDLTKLFDNFLENYMCKIRNVFPILLSAVISCNDFSPQFRTEKITLKFIQVDWLTFFFVQIARVHYFEPPLFQLYWFCIVEQNLRTFDKLLSDSIQLFFLSIFYCNHMTQSPPNSQKLEDM